MRTSLRVRQRGTLPFATVATYSQPMQAEADAVRMVRAGFHVELGHHGSRMRMPGRSRVWAGTEQDWQVIE